VTPFSAPLTLLLVTLTGLLGASSPEAARAGMPVRPIVRRDQIILHVPIAQRRDPPFKWVERKGPRCVAAGMIAGAAMASPSAIDFVLRDRRRVRAKFDSDCAGLDFYGGFYVEPRDQAVCAKREEIRSRAGSTCRIERFKSLVPKFKR
jgi:hypothetical protein